MPPKKVQPKKPVTVEPKAETKPEKPQKETKPKASKKAGLSKSKSPEEKKTTKAVAKSKDVKMTKEPKEEVKVNPAHKPRKALTAYTIFNTEFNKKMRDAGQTKDLFSLASQKWKSMTEKEQAPYHQKNELEKERHQRQCDELEKKGWFKLDDGTKSTDPDNAHLFKEKKPKKGKSVEVDEADEDVHPPPKRALTPWTLFVGKQSAIMRAAGKPQKECFTACGELWKEMTEKEKAPYLQENEKLKVIEQKQKDELAKKGYYTLQDGSKSTDPNNAELLKFKVKSKKSVPADVDQPKKISIVAKKAKKTKAGTKGSNGLNLDSDSD